MSSFEFEHYSENPTINYGPNKGFTISNKHEVTKTVSITRNGSYTILPDYPDSQCLSGITLSVNVETVPVRSGYKTILIPLEEGEEEGQVMIMENNATPVIMMASGQNSINLKGQSVDIPKGAAPTFVNTYDAASKTFIDKIAVIKSE